MPSLNESNEGRKYVKRPNANAAPCVNQAGRYVLPSMGPMPPGLFEEARRSLGSEPRSDANIPCQHKGAQVGSGGSY